MRPCAALVPGDSGIADATGRALRSGEIIAALNAQPDAGDVEAVVAILSRCMVTRVGAREIAEKIAAHYAAERAALASQAETMRGALEIIVRNDRSREYEHHEKRPWDGKKPSEASTGTKWLTPREIAKDALRALDGKATRANE
ncbi:MAG: hypothetical protein KGL39_17455 [Patescibacteria group bacterium]|nr:hypothetical protein [Patescibacteria group bacterium]